MITLFIQHSQGAALTDMVNVTGGVLVPKGCIQGKVDFVFKERADNSTWFPEIDPTVLLGVIDAIRNGDLMNEISSGFKKLFQGISIGRSWFLQANSTAANATEKAATNGSDVGVMF